MRTILCLSLLCLGSAAFAADWVDLMRRGNQTELERAAEGVGSSGLAQALAVPERAQRLAALKAVPGAEDSWALLGHLASAAEDPDRSLAIVAAQVAAEQVHRLDAFTIEFEEVLSEDLKRWQAAWLTLAQQPGRWIDIRVYSLEIAATLNAHLPPSSREPISWELFFADRDPEMRAAAISLAPPSATTTTMAETLVNQDPKDLVALSAAQRLCGPLGMPLVTAQSQVEQSTLRRLSALAQTKTLAIEARVDLANCLVRDKSEDSRRALSALAQQSPPSLRKALATLTKSSSQ